MNADKAPLTKPLIEPKGGHVTPEAAERQERLYRDLLGLPARTCPVHTGSPEPCPECESKIAAGL